MNHIFLALLDSLFPGTSQRGGAPTPPPTDHRRVRWTGLPGPATVNPRRVKPLRTIH